MRPLPVALVCGSLLVISVTVDHPLVLAATAVAAVGLLAAAPPPRRAYLWFASLSALLVFVVNPFAGPQGLTPVWHGPHLPLLDTEVTLEEIAFGAAAGLRIFASSLAVAAFVRLADGDGVLRGVSRIAPRSAMIVALAARLLPTLERDAAGIALATRARGGPTRGRRPAAELMAPLMALSLERSIGLAEAMEARGYGGYGRTHEPAGPATARESVLVVVGLQLAALAAWLSISDSAAYRYYDLLGDPRNGAAAAAAALLLVLAACAVGAVRWPR